MLQRCERLIRDYCSLLLRQQLSRWKIQSKVMRDWRTQWRCIETRVAATCVCIGSWTRNLLYHWKIYIFLSGSLNRIPMHICSAFIRHDLSSLKNEKKGKKKTSMFYSMHTSLSSSVSILWQGLTVPGFSRKSWIKRSRRRPAAHIQMVLNTD